MSQTVELQGTLDKIIFRSEESGFTVAILKVSSKETVTVRGSMPHIHSGEHVTITGKWVRHSKFGRQFEAEACTVALPSSAVGIQKYLASGLIKGIGPKYAKRIVDRFGSSTLEIIDKCPEKLENIDGIGPKRLEIIVGAWKDQKEISRVMVFLQERDISTGFAAKIFKRYGQESIAKIQENPFRLAEDIWGIGFKSADKVAAKLGFELTSISRVKAGVLHVIAEATNNGHLYIELEQLRTDGQKLLLLGDNAPGLIKRALHDLHDEEKIKVLTNQDLHYVTLPKYYYSEKGIAYKIIALQEKGSKDFKFDFDDVYVQLRGSDARGIMLNEDQQRGILACLQNKITIITGGPGTGKTTLIKKLLEVLDKYKKRFRLAAPTGRAAKRMFEGTGRNAETLHRLLEFSPQFMAFTKNEQNALDCDFLIVDEASMIDVFLMHSILRALSDRTHLILIGDIDQLPSVGAGNILGDLMASEQITVVALKEIFRQARDSLIIVNAHKINNGEFPISSLPGSKNDFKFIKENEPENIFELLRAIYGRISKQYKIPASEIIVLCPMNRGLVGTQRINQELQEMLNPARSDTKQVMRFSTAYRTGDRVMQIRNNYDKFVFNGDIGYVAEVNTVDQELMILFGDRTLLYDFSELNELVLSYAISIHKSQGSEFRAVVVPLFMQHFIMLQRNLIYTALTRAKEVCIFVGQTKALAMGIKNNKSVKRVTFLKEFLTTDLEAR